MEELAKLEAERGNPEYLAEKGLSDKKGVVHSRKGSNTAART